MLAKTDHKSLLALSERGLHRVARGLYLKVSEHDTKSWVFRYRDRATGKQRWMGLGAFPERLLSDVKDHKPTKGAPVDYRGPWDLKRCRETLHRGLDPITERERERAELRAGAIKVLSFDEAARQCHETRSGEFRNGKHRDDWISSLNRYASPIIGKLSVADIELPHILEVLKPIWSTKTETATRVVGDDEWISRRPEPRSLEGQPRKCPAPARENSQGSAYEGPAVADRGRVHGRSSQARGDGCPRLGIRDSHGGSLRRSPARNVG
jgi:hypothetical protein